MTETVKLRFPAKAVIEQDDKTIWIDTGMEPEELILAVAMSATGGPDKAVACRGVKG